MKKVFISFITMWFPQFPAVLQNVINFCCILSEFLSLFWFNVQTKLKILSRGRCSHVCIYGIWLVSGMFMDLVCRVVPNLRKHMNALGNCGRGRARFISDASSCMESTVPLPLQSIAMLHPYLSQILIDDFANC